MKLGFTLLATLALAFNINAQYKPSNLTPQKEFEAKKWVDNTYNSLSQDEKLGQLFIVALYTNKGNDHIQQIRDIVTKDKIGGLILMQDNATMHINLVNEFQKKSKVPMMIGIDGEWGVYQRIATAHKYPWALTLGAIQDKNLIYQMSQKIAEDCQRLGVNWDFAPVVDVNTNPNNPIIGNRSFGSDVKNVVESASFYTNGLQDNKILGAIKHFPGHGDTSTDSHLDLPLVQHPLSRLENVELAPFQKMIDKGVGGIMVAHLYVPALESQNGVPASVSHAIVTDLLKDKMGYKGLIITDALNMGAVANKYKAGELDAMAFKAGNDIMLFSQGVAEGKRLIQKAIDNGEISQKRVEESVKKILLTKYYLGLNQYTAINPENVDTDLNNSTHTELIQNLYSNAMTLLKNNNDVLPLKKSEKVYYLPLEEAPSKTFQKALAKEINIIPVNAADVNKIPANAKVIIGLHKDNSTAYKPYKISEASKKIIQRITAKNNVILALFGSPYALKDMDISKTKATVVVYENNDDSMNAAAKALKGETSITGRLPVEVTVTLPYGSGIDLKANSTK